MTKKDIIDKILKDIGLELKEFAMQCGIVPNTLLVSINRDALSDENINKIHDKFMIRKQFLKTGKGEIFEKGSLSTPTEEKNLKLSDYSLDEYDLLNPDSNYRLIPKKVLDEYNIIPERVINFLITSMENERNLNKEYDIAVRGLQNQTARLQARINELEKEKEELLRKITTQKK